MKKLITLAFAFLFAASASFAGEVNKNSSWDEILADDSLRVVFPMISVGNGHYVSYDQLFLDHDKLTAGTTYEDPVETVHTAASRERERDPIVIRTVTRKTESPLNYTYRDCTEFKVTSEDGDKDYEPIVCNPVAGRHSLTVNVDVYKQGAIHGAREDANQKDTFLFTKKYTVPAYRVK